MGWSGLSGNKYATLLLLAAFGVILSSLARLPCPEHIQAAEFFNEMENIAAAVQPTASSQFNPVSESASSVHQQS